MAFSLTDIVNVLAQSNESLWIKKRQIKENICFVISEGHPNKTKKQMLPNYPFPKFQTILFFVLLIFNTNYY